MQQKDYKLCIEEAKAFLQLAKTVSNDLDGLITGMMYPCVVNIVFSCELFLKAIMIKRFVDDSQMKKHNLKELFESLDISDQQGITKQYDKEGTLPLKMLLDESQNAFIKWRYAYEEGVEIHISEILKFADALSEFVDEL